MSILLEANKVMTVTASAYSDGAYWALGNPGDPSSDYHDVDAGDSATIGPFNADKVYELKNLSYAISSNDLQGDDRNTVHLNDTDASGYSFVLDEDDMASDDDTKLPTQQSVKAYVDANFNTTTEQLQDAVGAMFTGNTETGISVDYQDTDGTIDLAVDDAYIQNLIAGNDITDLTALNEANVATIGNSATGTEIATAVNGILAILIAAGLMAAP